MRTEVSREIKKLPDGTQYVEAIHKNEDQSHRYFVFTRDDRCHFSIQGDAVTYGDALRAAEDAAMRLQAALGCRQWLLCR